LINLKTYEHFISKFSNEDIDEVDDEFQIIADSYNLKKIDGELNELEGVNQYTIKSGKVISIKILIFDHQKDSDSSTVVSDERSKSPGKITIINLIKDDLEIFINRMENIGWKLCDKHESNPIFPIRVEHYPSLRDDVASFKELTIYLTK